MPVKRQNAFSRALKEAQQPPEAAPPPEQPTPLATPAPAAGAPEQVRDRTGRPRSTVPKKKFTYYLDATSDEAITAIKKALVRHADVLLDDKGAVVEHALAVMRFGLEDPASRAAFLALYDRWATANED